MLFGFALKKKKKQIALVATGAICSWHKKGKKTVKNIQKFEFLQAINLHHEPIINITLF